MVLNVDISADAVLKDQNVGVDTTEKRPTSQRRNNGLISLTFTMIYSYHLLSKLTRIH